jgi:hypothetical protein
MLNLKININMKNRTSFTRKLGISFYAMLAVVFFYAMLVAVFFASCTNDINNEKSPLVVNDFRSYYKGGLCDYTLIYGDDGKDYIHLIDSCGKYKIGDTLFVGKKHCH